VARKERDYAAENLRRKERQAANAGPAPDAVRTQVKTMTGFGSEAEMAASLPENTITGGEGPELTPTGRIKRKLGPRASTIAARGVQEDPLLQDRRYVRAVGKATFFGAPKAVKGAFSVAATIAEQPAIALDEEETEDVDDFFYALSKRRTLGDPFATWYGSLLYFLAMLGTLIGTRFANAKGQNFQKSLAKMFGYGKDEDEDPNDRKDSIGE
jgi:hypothetical protein